MAAGFRPVFPENQGHDGTTVRSVIWVSSAIDTANWEIVNVPNTNDITAIQLKGEYGKITIINVYNDCAHPASEKAIRALLIHCPWAGPGSGQIPGGPGLPEQGQGRPGVDAAQSCQSVLQIILESSKPLVVASKFIFNKIILNRTEGLKHH